MNIQEKITILILFHRSRVKELKKKIEYFSNTKFKILMLGQMDNPHELRELIKIKNIKNLRLVISKNQYPGEKQLEAESLIDTEYMIFLGDDDFVTFDYLEKSIKILDEKKNVHVVDCFTTKFKINESEQSLIFLNNYMINYYFFFKRKNFYLKGDDLFERINKLQNSYNPNLHHCVVRKSTFYFSLKTIQNNTHCDVLNYYDKLFFLLFLLKGDIYFLNIHGYVRQVENSLRAGYLPEKYFLKNKKFLNDFLNDQIALDYLYLIINKDLRCNNQVFYKQMNNFYKVIKNHYLFDEKKKDKGLIKKLRIKINNYLHHRFDYFNEIFKIFKMPSINKKVCNKIKRLYKEFEL